MMMGNDVRFASPGPIIAFGGKCVGGGGWEGEKTETLGKEGLTRNRRRRRFGRWRMGKRGRGEEVFLAPKNQGVGKRRKDKASEEQWRRERKNGKKGYEAPSSLISRERGKDGMKKKQKRNQRIAFLFLAR